MIAADVLSAREENGLGGRPVETMTKTPEALRPIASPGLDEETELRRRELLERHADPTTIRRLEATGVGPGWRCLELDGGAGSIARWLRARVGAAGEVRDLDLATALRALDGEPAPVPFPQFDLVHTRCVLMHARDRSAALERIASWLRPGGWLVSEELDSMAIVSDADPERAALLAACQRALPDVDFECGRALGEELKAAGFVDVIADFCLDVVEGGTRLAAWERQSIEAIRARVLDAGTATPEQIEAHLARLDDPGYCALGFTWVGAFGRRDLAG